MSKNDKNVPHRRFKEFENAEDWEQRKLGELVEIGDIDHRMPQTVDSGIPYLMTGDFSGINDLDFSKAKLISEEDYNQLSKKIKPEKKDIIFARYASVGAVRYVDFTRDFLISYSCAIIKSSKKIDSKFLYNFLTSDSAQKQIQLEINTGSQANIGIDSMKNNIMVKMPSNEEQVRISSYLSNLDNLITLHQRKLEKMKALKKAYLTDMFPAEGECRPKLRFDGFTDDWEQCKLNEFTSYNSSSLKVSDSNEVGLYKLYDANGVIGYTNTTAQTENYITIIKDGAGVGRVRILPKKTSFIGTMGAILPRNCDIYFLFNILINTNFNCEISGGTIPHIYYSQYGNKQYYIPNFEEQQKIGAFFTQLDNFITLHQRKLGKLQNIKRAYLNEMFI